MKTHGFTLIELSIVLVIIGLLAGGILVGNDLIKAAEIRGTISQVERYNTATQTFILKYNYLPGDMPPTQASQLGFFTESQNISPQVIFDDGRIQNYTKVDCNFDIYNGETLAYWRHLSDAKMVEGNWGTNLDTSGTPDYSMPTSPDLYMPKAKLGDIFFFPVFKSFTTSDRTINANFYLLHNTDEASLSATDSCPRVKYPSLLDPSGMDPQSAYAIDSKMDDGTPNGGSVIVGSSLLWQATASSGVCTYGGNNATDILTQYNLASSTGGTTKSCVVFIKTGF